MTKLAKFKFEFVVEYDRDLVALPACPNFDDILDGLMKSLETTNNADPDKPQAIHILPGGKVDIRRGRR